MSNAVTSRCCNRDTTDAEKKILSIGNGGNSPKEDGYDALVYKARTDGALTSSFDLAD
jgi:hypothetical protein